MAKKVNIQFDAEELQKAIGILYEVTDDGPAGEGWKSEELIALIRKLEEAAGVSEKDKW